MDLFPPFLINSIDYLQLVPKKRFILKDKGNKNRCDILLTFYKFNYFQFIMRFEWENLYKLQETNVIT